MQIQDISFPGSTTNRRASQQAEVESNLKPIALDLLVKILFGRSGSIINTHENFPRKFLVAMRDDMIPLDSNHVLFLELLWGKRAVTALDDLDLFLDPPHHHCPDDFAEATTAAPLFMKFVHPDLRRGVQAINMSTSILFASLKRLRELNRDMIDLFMSQNARCSTLNPGLSNAEHNAALHHEPRIFNSTMRFCAEKQYFDTEVVPDWRHKATTLDLRLQDTDSTRLLKLLGLESALRTWWAALKTLANDWLEESQFLTIPDVAWAQPSHTEA